METLKIVVIRFCRIQKSGGNIILFITWIFHGGLFIVF